MFTAAVITITRHGNIGLGSIMLSHSDTARYTPEALKDIPHGIKKVLRTDGWWPILGWWWGRGEAGPRCHV